jgi:hypothetical protein
MRIRYETAVHHRQNLRSQLDQNLISRLELSAHPSHNYQQAYQSINQD